MNFQFHGPRPKLLPNAIVWNALLTEVLKGASYSEQGIEMGNKEGTNELEMEAVSW